MAKVFCLLNDRSSMACERMEKALNYNEGGKRKVYSDEDIHLGCFEMPNKKEDDFWLENRDYVFVMDGTINSWFKDVLGKTVIEKVQNLFLKEGENTAKNINGDFSIFIWDKRRKRLVVMNDRMGLRPVYYAQSQLSKLTAT